MSLDVLPDSRLKVPTGTVMADWSLPSGGTIRIEMEKSYCINCGVPVAWVPKENVVSFVTICNDCFKRFGAIPNHHAVSDTQFCLDVGHELEARYGRALTDEELQNEIRDHNLGPALEALLRDSPFPAPDNRPKR